MIVTGDTNFYRKIVEEISIKDMWKVGAIVKELTRAERKKGIKAMMGSIAASELLSHLLDNPKTRDYRSCLKACKVMYGHCKEDENSFNRRIKGRFFDPLCNNIKSRYNHICRDRREGSCRRAQEGSRDGSLIRSVTI